MTALCMAYSSLSGAGPLLISLIGNGRASWLGGIDVSQTIGWLSCEVPAVVDVTPAADLFHAVALLSWEYDRYFHTVQNVRALAEACAGILRQMAREFAESEAWSDHTPDVVSVVAEGP